MESSKPSISRIAHLINSGQALLPKLCHECYTKLEQAVCHAEQAEVVALHCPHYSVLVAVSMLDGMPGSVIMTGPISQEDVNENMNQLLGFEA